MNMVDPSGRCKTAIPCEALPPELSALINCEPDDRDLGDLVEYLRHLQIIKESSVEIVTGDWHSPDCSALIGSGTWAVSANSGTITHNGLWIHAHYTGTGENFGSIPANNDQAAEWLKSWPCIILTGATGRVVLRGADLDLSYLNTPAGTLLIQPYQKQASSFTIVDLRTVLGTPASDEFVPFESVDRVYISYGRLIGVLEFAYHTNTEWLIQFYSIR